MKVVLIDQEEYQGNLEDYADPRNSLLHEVIDRKLGLPITLSVVWLDITAMLGWPFTGVALPGHYIIKRESADGRMLIDPFSGGQVIQLEDCTKLIKRATGKDIQVSEEELGSARVKPTLTRMLGNLRQSYAQRGSWAAAARAVQRMVALEPESEHLKMQFLMFNSQMAKLN